MDSATIGGFCVGERLTDAANKGRSDGEEGEE